MKKGFYTIMSAQFFSSLADNALLVAAIEMLRTSGAPAWHVPALTPMFALFYVLLAPFVGAFADAVPKPARRPRSPRSPGAGALCRPRLRPG